jgi:hypothetical protein
VKHTHYRKVRKNEKAWCFRCHTFIKPGDWLAIGGEGRTFTHVWVTHRYACPPKEPSG